MAIYKNQSKLIQFAMVSTAGALSSATPIVQISGDGGAYATTAAPSAVANVSGAWALTLSAGQMNYDVVHIVVTATGCIPIQMTLYTESDWTSSKAADIDATISSRQAAGSPVTLPSTAPSGFLDSASIAAIWTYTSRTLTAFGTALVDSIWTRLRSATSPPSGSYGYFLDTQVSTVATGGVGASTIAAAVWNEATSAHTTAGTYGVGVPLQLSQAVGHTQSAGTLGRILQIIRAFGRGNRVLSSGANTETIYDTDGTTIVGAAALTPAGGPYTTKTYSNE